MNDILFSKELGGCHRDCGILQRIPPIRRLNRSIMYPAERYPILPCLLCNPNYQTDKDFFSLSDYKDQLMSCPRCSKPDENNASNYKLDAVVPSSSGGGDCGKHFGKSRNHYQPPSPNFRRNYTGGVGAMSKNSNSGFQDNGMGKEPLHSFRTMNNSQNNSSNNGFYNWNYNMNNNNGYQNNQQWTQPNYNRSYAGKAYPGRTSGMGMTPWKGDKAKNIEILAMKTIDAAPQINFSPSRSNRRNNNNFVNSIINSSNSNSNNRKGYPFFYPSPWEHNRVTQMRGQPGQKQSRNVRF